MKVKFDCKTIAVLVGIAIIVQYMNKKEPMCGACAAGA